MRLLLGSHWPGRGVHHSLNVIYYIKKDKETQSTQIPLNHEQGYNSMRNRIQRVPMN